MTGHSLAAACALAFVALGAEAGDVYRWVDEDGRTHLSDSVPEKYREGAKRYGPGDDKPTERQRKDSLLRTRRDQERGSALEQARQARDAQEAASAAAR